MGTPGIDQQRERGKLAIDDRFFEQQGLSAGSFLHLRISDRRDFKFSIYRHGHALQFAGPA
jgi:hypothetical protein